MIRRRSARASGAASGARKPNWYESRSIPTDGRASILVATVAGPISVAAAASPKRYDDVPLIGRGGHGCSRGNTNICTTNSTPESLVTQGFPVPEPAQLVRD